MTQAELFPSSDLITVTPSMVADYLFFLLPNQQVKMDLKEITQETIEKFYSLIEEMFTKKNYPPRKNLYCQDCVFDCPLK